MSEDQRTFSLMLNDHLRKVDKVIGRVETRFEKFEKLHREDMSTLHMRINETVSKGDCAEDRTRIEGEQIRTGDRLNTLETNKMDKTTAWGLVGMTSMIVGIIVSIIAVIKKVM